MSPPCLCITVDAKNLSCGQEVSVPHHEYFTGRDVSIVTCVQGICNCVCVFYIFSLFIHMEKFVEIFSRCIDLFTIKLNSSFALTLYTYHFTQYTYVLQICNYLEKEQLLENRTVPMKVDMLKIRSSFRRCKDPVICNTFPM